MTEQTTLEIIFDDWEKIIENIWTNWVSPANQRSLIAINTKFLIEIGTSRKLIKDKRLSLKTRENSDKQKFIEWGMAKTPAWDLVQENSRPARYDLEKLEIDIETMQEIAKNRKFYIRLGEIDLNKNWMILDN